MSRPQKLLIRIDGTDNDGQDGTQNFKLPTKNDWCRNLQFLNKKIAKKMQTDDEYALLINDCIVRYDDGDGLSEAMRNFDFNKIPHFKIVDINLVGNSDKREIIIHFNDNQCIFKIPKELNELDDETYDELLECARIEFKIKGRMGKIYEDVDGEPVYVDDCEDLTECLEDKEDDEPFHLYLEDKKAKMKKSKSKSKPKPKAKPKSKPAYTDTFKVEQEYKEEPGSAARADDPFYEWCVANKVGRFYTKLQNELYFDSVKAIASYNNLEEICQELGLKFGVKAKFINAVNQFKKDEYEEKKSEGTEEGLFAEQKEEEKQKPKPKPKPKPGLHRIAATAKQPKNSTRRRNRTIMVIGETGTGKTTLINSMMNYLYQVTFEDEYRYILIKEPVKEQGQAMSQTDKVTSYYFEPSIVDYGLTVIDTPGFGDTRGLEQDKKIIKNIKTFFENEMETIDAVCFVIRAPQSRLTAPQKYIFAQVLGIFGKDIVDNIFVLFTFADAKKPQALAALKEGKIPFRRFYKINNSAFFLEDAESGNEQTKQFDKMFYDMGLISFDAFFKDILTVQPKSLQLTKNVLREREQLETYILSIRPVISQGLSVLDNIKTQLTFISQLNDDIAHSKNFTVKTTRPQIKKVPLGTGIHTTTCLVCNFTCHNGCGIAEDSDKSGCVSMSGGYCTVCKHKCHWKKHSNVPYVITYTDVPHTVTSQELKAKYVKANSDKSTKAQMIDGLSSDFFEHEKKLNYLIKNVRDCINKLQKIALRANVLDQDEYLDTLIESEKQERKTGWQARVSSLQALKKDQEVIKNAMDEDYNPWKQHLEIKKNLLV